MARKYSQRHASAAMGEALAIHRGQRSIACDSDRSRPPSQGLPTMLAKHGTSFWIAMPLHSSLETAPARQRKGAWPCPATASLLRALPAYTEPLHARQILSRIVQRLYGSAEGKFEHIVPDIFVQGLPTSASRPCRARIAQSISSSCPPLPLVFPPFGPQLESCCDNVCRSRKSM